MLVYARSKLTSTTLDTATLPAAVGPQIDVLWLLPLFADVLLGLV